MNLIQKARFQFSKLFKPSTDQALRNVFNEAFLWGLGGYTQYDTKGKTYIDKGYNHNAIVYSIINQQASKTASIPFSVKEVEDKQSMRKLRQLDNATKGEYSVQQYVKRAVLESKAFNKNEKEFPLEKPNANQTWMEFLALYKTFLKLTGNVYIYVLAPEMGMNAGQPVQVYLLPSQFMQIDLKHNANVLSTEDPVSGYRLVWGRNFIQFDANDVIHIKYSNPNYGENGEHLYGQSPLRAALRNIQSSNTAIDLNIKTLKSGGAFGFLSAKNTAFTPQQAAEIKQRMVEMDASPENLAKIAAVSVATDFQRISLTADELKPFDYLKFDSKMIANVLSWDDKLLNSDDGAKYDNVAQARKRVVTDNIIPDLDLLSNALNSQFLPRFKGYENTIIVFDAMQLPEMQTDTSELVSWLKEALDRGVISRNEFRLAINYTKVENDDNMDKFTVNADIMSLDEALDTSFNIE